MNKKTLLILAFVFILLAVILVIVRTAGRNERSESHINTQDIHKIVVKAGGADESTELEKKDDGWYVGKWPADNKASKNIITALGDLQLEDIISTRKEKYGDFEVDEESATVVTAETDSGNSIKIYVGKRSAEWTRNFVRIEGDPAVYLTRSISRQMADREWRSRNIISDPDNGTVEETEIEYKDRKFSLDKSTQAGENIRDNMRRLTASGFVDEPGKDIEEHFNDAFMKIKLKYRSGPDAVFTALKIDDKAYLKAENTGLIYEIREDALDKLTEAIENNKEHPLEKKDPPK
ncbi:MAG: DUF4340 domain-containing protein [Elusimicrobiota bacterium]